jgi:Concanavalin A-like lectin/glucanases superfamily
MRSLTRMSRMMDKEGISRLGRAIALGLLMGSVAASGSVYANSCDLVKEGLVACYSFDGNANDASGNWNNGMVNGAVDLITDRFGNTNGAYDFKSGYIEIPDSNSLDLTTGLTMMAWVNPREQIYEQLQTPTFISTGGGIIFNKEGNYEMALTTGTNTIRYAFALNGSDQWSDTGVSVELNRWTLVTVSYNGETIKVYKNGELVHQRVEKGVAPTSNAAAGIGSRQMGQGTYPSWVSRFNGMIDDVRIYNRAISEEEVKQLYEPAQNCKDKHATFDSTTGLVSIPALDIPTLDPFTGEPTGMLATFSAQLNLLKGVEDFGLIPDSFKVLQVDVTTPDPCNAGYSYADGKYSKGGTLHLPYVDVPSVIVIPPNTRIPGPVLVYDATLKQLAVDSVVFHIADYKNMGTLAIAK